MRRSHVTALLATGLAVALLGANLADAAPKPRQQDQQQADGGPNFTSPCRYSHRAKDDPIVFPAQPGASHSHDFIGNASTNAFSTYQTLQAMTDTSCLRKPDTAGYWVPTLYNNGVAVTPTGTTAYYLPAGKDLASIKPFPAGLKVVAGNSKATGPQELKVVRWACVGDTETRASSTPPTCPSDSQLLLVVRFPDCWNGTDLDSADHKSHLSYSMRGRCDSAHPVALPLLALHVRYGHVGGSGITLASGSAYTAHADFFNAWDQKTLTYLCQKCLNGGQHCGRGNPA